MLAPLVAVLGLGVTGVAAASELPTATARLEIHALPDCTTREELAARVAARSRRIRFEEDGAGPILRAVIAPGPRGGAVGELVIAEPGGKTSVRRLSAPSCAEATDAIALIIALTLDPTSAAGRAPGSAGPAPVTSPASPAVSSPPSAGASGADRPGESAAVASPGDRTTEAQPAPGRPAPPPAPEPAGEVAVAPPAPAARVASELSFGGGGAVEAVTGPAPATLPGASLYLFAALDRDALWSPAAFLRGTHAWQSGLLESGGTAAFTLDALTLDACALRAHASAFAARLCATGLYGRLAASGTETYSPAAATRPYAVAGAAVLLSAALGRLFELSARVGGGASLIRDSYSFSPTVFHRTAAVTVTAGVGFGVRFP
ncbi:MAG TPA: hypothetical protein VKZ18_03690 [Polyangia bacterium]|nr:hypothetical protein [Polyangia bacterium]